MNIEILSEIIIPLIGFVLLYVMYPLVKQKIGNEKMKDVLEYSRILFKAAEEIFDYRLAGKEKHEFVKDKLVNEKGITPEEADLIIKALTTEYNKINNELE